MFVLAGVGVAASTSRRPPAFFALGIGVVATIVVGLTALYFVAWKATAKSQRWAPLTMAILFSIAFALNVVGIATGGVRAGTNIFYAVLAGLFGYISARAYTALGKYLAQPAWCHELFAVSEK